MKQKDLLFIVISSTFLVLLWIIFNVIHQAVTTTISEPLSQDIKPISGSFDTKTFQALQKRIVVTPQEGIQLASTPTPTPTIPPISPVSPFGSSQTPTPTPTTPPLTPVQNLGTSPTP